MQVCTSLQTDNHTSTPPLSFFTGRMPHALPAAQPTASERKFFYEKNFKTWKNKKKRLKT